MVPAQAAFPDESADFASPKPGDVGIAVRLTRGVKYKEVGTPGRLASTA